MGRESHSKRFSATSTGLMSDDQFRSLQMMEGFRSLELGFLRSEYCISTIREKQSRWIELPNDQDQPVAAIDLPREKPPTATRLDHFVRPSLERIELCGIVAQLQWTLQCVGHSLYEETAMQNSDVSDFVQKAEAIYESRLQGILEPCHEHEFVAIEPESGEYFLGKTLNDAAKAARAAYPSRLTHVMRVGHKAAIHLG